MPRMMDILASQKEISVPDWWPDDTSREVLEGEDIRDFMASLVTMNRAYREYAIHAPVFEVTNVHEYVKQREIKIYEDWPCLMLPLDIMWMEYRRSDNSTPSRVGVLLTRLDQRVEDDRLWQFPNTRHTAKHCVNAMAYFTQQDRVVGPVALWDVALDEHGAPVEFAYKHMSINGYDSNAFMLGKLAAFFQALAFMHCKNAQMQQEQPPEKLSRKWQKKTGQPLVKWNTLTIQPLKETLARESRNTRTTGINSSAHIARGHFAEYGEEFGKGKLFGKYEGRFWIPAHVRGAKEEGMVLHDYEVKA